MHFHSASTWRARAGQSCAWQTVRSVERSFRHSLGFLPRTRLIDPVNSGFFAKRTSRHDMR